MEGRERESWRVYIPMMRMVERERERNNGMEERERERVCLCVARSSC